MQDRGNPVSTEGLQGLTRRLLGVACPPQDKVSILCHTGYDCNIATNSTLGGYYSLSDPVPHFFEGIAAPSISADAVRDARVRPKDNGGVHAVRHVSHVTICDTRQLGWRRKCRPGASIGSRDAGRGGEQHVLGTDGESSATRMREPGGQPAPSAHKGFSAQIQVHSTSFK